MGDFRVVIEAVGGHGCDRDAKEGEDLKPPCGSPSCPDCLFRAFVSELRNKMTVNHATLTHWPSHLDHRDSPYQSGTRDITDDLLAGKRTKGAF